MHAGRGRSGGFFFFFLAFAVSTIKAAREMNDVVCSKADGRDLQSLRVGSVEARSPALHNPVGTSVGEHHFSLSALNV